MAPGGEASNLSGRREIITFSYSLSRLVEAQGGSMTNRHQLWDSRPAQNEKPIAQGALIGKSPSAQKIPSSMEISGPAEALYLNESLQWSLKVFPVYLDLMLLKSHSPSCLGDCFLLFLRKRHKLRDSEERKLQPARFTNLTLYSQGLSCHSK